jgi:hypothetical protein
MKTSSGLLLGVLFTLVVVIVALVIYFNTRPEEEEKPETLDGPTLPGISDLTVSRTDSPDSGSEPYTIEPYTIEYAEGDSYVEGDNEKALSKNITFTLNWTNNDGFDDVTEIKVEHYINTTGNEFTLHDSAKKNSKEAKFLTSFNDVSFPVAGNGEYSFVGKNRFKISAVLNRRVGDESSPFQSVTLYDGRFEADGETVKDIKQLDIKQEDLTATIGMALALEKTFALELRDDSDNDAKGTTSVIKNKTYTFSAKQYDGLDEMDEQVYSNTVTYEKIELISQDDKGEKFKFRKLGTQEYWGTTNVTPTAAGAKPYKKLITNATFSTAANITFVKSKQNTADEKFRSFKIVAGTEAAPIDMYLHGITGDVTFRSLDDPKVSMNQKLSNTRHWKITETTT